MSHPYRSISHLALLLSVAFSAISIPLSSAPAADALPSLANVTARIASGEATRIVCFGDSVTGVYYHSGSQRAWCDMLGLALKKAYPKANLEMINAGISGHTTVNALDRIDNDVIAKKPHLVVVMFGLNDVVRVKPDLFRKNLGMIAQKCHAAGAAVVFCTPNSVYENGARPNSRVDEYSQIIRDLATELKLPLVDVFADYRDFRKREPREWKLLMSDPIHPNMNGHKRFAELMTATISGKRVSLADVAPPNDALHTTFDRLQKKLPVKLVAMPPYDKLFPAALRAHFPDAEFQVTTWPSAGESLSDLNAWGKRIRKMSPHLVVIAVPVSANSPDEQSTITNYEWVLNWSFHFGNRLWDVVPVLPDVADPDLAKDHPRATLMHRIVIGKDVQFLQRGAKDSRPAHELVSTWIAEHKKDWLKRQP